MSISISQVFFEHHREPFGIDENRPRISWRFEGDALNWEQSAYDIEITGDASGVPKLYNFNDSASVLVSWPGNELDIADSASLRVRAYGKAGQPNTTWSQRFNVESNLHLSERIPEGANLIAADRQTEIDGPKQPILFRKKFNVEGVITKARLYITALGLYEAEINGKRVGDQVLAPGWQSYPDRHAYETYDVSDFLIPGENVLGATVGEGWYSGRIGFGKNPRNLYGDTLALFAVLTYVDSNGTQQNITTDSTWKANTGPIITSEIYNGEKYDSTKEFDRWTLSTFDDTKWLATKAIERTKGRGQTDDWHFVKATAPPIRRLEERKPSKIFSSTSGKTVLDFGQNMVGWLRLNVSGPAGTNITLLHTEVLENGEVATRPLRSATATDTLILNGKGRQVWEPKFTYHGFRYVQVTGWPNETTLDWSSVTAVIVGSDMERTGSFNCSNDLLNKLHENVVWSMKGNFLTIPTDCPQRDERLGWTGDAHVFMPTANFLYNTAGFWRGWLSDVGVEATANDSHIPPYYVPTDDTTEDDFERVRKPTAVWGDVVVANAWNLYRSTGDTEMLLEQVQAARHWVDMGIPRNEAGLWDRSTYQFGDWLDPRAPPDDPGAATTDKHLVADAYLIRMTEYLANISAAIGKTSVTESYTNKHTELINAFQEAWIKPYDVIANVTQTALALSLEFGIFNTSESTQKAASMLKQVIATNNYQIGTGFAGTHVLGHALSRINATQDFYKILLQTTVPSWLYEVNMGATTTWERWDSMLPNGTINPGSMTSFNHYAFGSVADWMHQKIGGLAPLEPGWKKTLVAPEPGGGIKHADASYLSPYGLVSSSWNVNDTGLHLKVKVPPNARALVKVPGLTGNVSQVEVGSGSWEWLVPGFDVDN